MGAKPRHMLLLLGVEEYIEDEGDGEGAGRKSFLYCSDGFSLRVREELFWNASVGV